MADRNPVAFMTYLHRVDQHDRGRLTQLRERLEGEIQVITGVDFTIFQDRQDIRWGQQWKGRIAESLNDITFLIPIITPGFFNSKPCREEIELFLERERKLERSDLILPIYYIDYPDFNDEEHQRHDPLVMEIAKHQYADWRDLRHEPPTSKLAVTFRDAIKERRAGALPNVVASVPIPTRQDPPRAEPTPAAEPPQAASAAGPTAKPELPKLVVNQLHRGDHTTIAAAIKAARPGTLVAVEPGLYREGLVIDKPLEIVGQGAIDDVVIEIAGADVVLFQATMGRIANVSLRQSGDSFYAVNITRGRLDLEDCDITSQGSACVAVHDGADPRLRRNRIHDGKRSGVYVLEQGRGTLEDNDIFANAFAGVEIKTGGDPVLRRNRIHDGKAGGVFVQEEGRGSLEDNDIFANASAGVEIRTGGDPVLRRNRIHDGKAGGVFVQKEGRGSLEDNDIFANAYTGVEIKTGGDPVLRRNRISQNGHEGIRVYERGRGTFEANDLRGNTRGAWDVGRGTWDVGRGTWDVGRGTWDVEDDCRNNIKQENNIE